MLCHASGMTDNLAGAGTSPTPDLEAASLDQRLGAMSYSRPFRRYQSLALEAFERDQAANDRRAYLVLPPGAGKTVLGLEIARRLGRQTLILAPNTAVQAQWLQQWSDFHPPLVAASAQALESPITVLTYQALCVLDRDAEEQEDAILSLWREDLQSSGGLSPEAAAVEQQRLRETEPGSYRVQVDRFRHILRTLIARGGDRAQLLALLHPNGRRLVDAMKRGGPWTLVLDECHHLLRMWGHVAMAVIEELGPDIHVVGLTATPPGDMEKEEAELYRHLFGSVDFEVPTPAVVKEGDLAPYQTLAQLTTPLPHEIEFIESRHVRFQELLTDLLDPAFASVSFEEWLRRRVDERLDRNGAQVSWRRFSADHPDLVRAALRWMCRQQMAPPEGARFSEADRTAPDADDWVALLDDYIRTTLRGSQDERDRAAIERIKKGLASLGYSVTGTGIRRSASPVDRVLALSASKGEAAVQILTAEEAALAAELRALIVCDYEVAGSEVLAELRGVLDPQAGSAALLLHILTGAVDHLHPVLVTGRTVACSRATASELCTWIEGQVPALRGALTTSGLFEGEGTIGWEDVIVIRPGNSWWQTRNYVPLLTRYFQEGHSRCLVGTRGLLGEGWDASKVNVLIDLTAAATLTSVHQLRGRSLRLDPALPRKVAHNWDVVCLAPQYPKGVGDYERFVRKHAHYYGPTESGDIESGVSHVHPALSPFGPPPPADIPAINQSLLNRSGERERAYELWRIGQPYHNAEAQTVRMRLSRSAAHAAVEPPAETILQPPRPSPATRTAGTAVAAAGAAAIGAGAGIALVGGVAALAAIGGGTTWIMQGVRQAVERNGPSSAIDDMIKALADALAASGGLRPDLGAGSIRVDVEQDGYYRCFLEGATLDESRLFADSADELLAPLANPRYIIPRYVGSRPGSIGAALKVYLRQRRMGRVGEAIVYHAVPAYLAANKTRVAAFEAAWNRYVSAGSAIFRTDPQFEGIVAAQGGDNVFDVTTQMRTVWR